MSTKWLSAMISWVLMSMLLAACAPASVPTTTLDQSATPLPMPVTPIPSVTLQPSSTPRPALTSAPTGSPVPVYVPTLPPSPTPTPAPVIEGYWIQNTVREGLCTDSPRFIEFDASPNYLIGDGSSMVCSTGTIEPHAVCGCGGDCPHGLPSWHTIVVPSVGSVTSGTYIHPDESESDWADCYEMPSFAGSGGRCILDMDSRWQCFTSADGLPFDDVRAYGVVEETGVEWFMSEDSVASRGVQPQDQFYSISALVGDSDVRLTWLAVSESAAEGVWVGTSVYGLLHIQSSPQQITRYTTADGLPDDQIRDVQTCGLDCVWVATPKGIGHWDGHSWMKYTTQQGLPSDDVRGISFTPLYRRDFRSDVWAATAAGPAWFIKKSRWWQALPDWPADVEVTGVMGDWFSTRGHGLIRFIEAPVTRGMVEVFTTTDGLPSNRITALAATARGVLVGTALGAMEWDGAVWMPVTDVPVTSVSGGMIGTERGLWVWGGGIWEQVSNERITRVAENGWYATLTQVCRWTGSKPYCPLTDDGRALTGIQALYAAAENWCVAVDGDAQIWKYDAQACDGGCFVMSAYLGGCSSILPERINGIVAPDEDNWWIATDKGVYWGLYNQYGGDSQLAGGWTVVVRDVNLNGQTAWIATNQGAFYSYPQDYGYGWSYISDLPDQNLSAVLPLPDGSAWIGTLDAGVIRFVPWGE
ncbi:MAG: hypothetical protein JXA21_20070 [Anaerolineae bacterium]|nr:hypothetical protein [Anaerolineae bacterium]